MLKENDCNVEIDDTMKCYKLSETKQVSKQIYWNLIEKYYPPSSSAYTRWQHELKLDKQDDITWKNLLPEFFRMIKPTKLRYFQYRVLTKTLTTNVLRGKWDKI